MKEARRLMLSERAQEYPASGIRTMFDLAAKYPDSINLTCGDPNFDTPANIRAAAKQALDEGYTHYSPNAGYLPLREAVAQRYKQYYPFYSADNVIITVGALEALTLGLLATIDPDDEVIVVDPYFSNYAGQILLAGGKTVMVNAYEENDYKVKAEDIEKVITPKTKAVILNFPCNPTGAVLEKEDVLEIAEVIKKYNLYLFSDEPYDTLLFDDAELYSFAQVDEIRSQVFILNSFSKAYAMTGWRVGYMLCDAKYMVTLAHLQEGLVSCVSTFSQVACVEALTGPQEDQKQMIREYKRRRDILMEGLNKIPGFRYKGTKGSFYSFVNIEAFGKSSQEFAEELVKHAGVVTVPGSAFGKMGEGHLRLVFANSDENLKEAVRRIDAYVRQAYPDIR